VRTLRFARTLEDCTLRSYVARRINAKFVAVFSTPNSPLIEPLAPRRIPPDRCSALGVAGPRAGGCGELHGNLAVLRRSGKNLPKFGQNRPKKDL
jgi:hypothetical protein